MIVGARCTNPKCKNGKSKKLFTNIHPTHEPRVGRLEWSVEMPGLSGSDVQPSGGPPIRLRTVRRSRP